MAVKTCKKCGESNTEAALICMVCSSSLKDLPLVVTLNTEKKEFSGVLWIIAVAPHWKIGFLTIRHTSRTTRSSNDLLWIIKLGVGESNRHIH